MFRKFMAAAVAAVTAVVLTACSSGNGEYVTGVKAEDYVEPCDYNSIPIEEAAPTVSDAYRDYYIQYQLSNSATTQEVTDRDDVEDGDIVNIDYTGKIDGETFDGGSATDYDLTIGSGNFIDGFEDGLIGHKVGETLDLNLKFPDDYSNSDVAGKDVVFTVTINKISQRVTPELTDEWVQTQNIAGVSTVAQYQDYVYNQLMTVAQQNYDSDVQDKIAQYMVDNSTYKQDPPQAMIDRLSESMKDYYTQMATQYGMELDDFLKSYAGADEDDPEAKITENATNSAKELLVMKVIADREDLNPSRTEINQEVSSRAASAGYSSVSDYKKATDPEEFKENLMLQNVLEFLAGRADVTEPAEDSSSDAAADSSTESSTEAAAEAATENSTEASAGTENSEDAASESGTDASADSSVESASESTAETTGTTEE